MSWNDFKMPHTVPNKPMNGASERSFRASTARRRIWEIASLPQVASTAFRSSSAMFASAVPREKRRRAASSRTHTAIGR